MSIRKEKGMGNKTVSLTEKAYMILVEECFDIVLFKGLPINKLQRLLTKST